MSEQKFQVNLFHLPLSHSCTRPRLRLLTPHSTTTLRTMAIPIETTTPPHSLLITLRAVQRSQQTRTSLSHELDGQYSSFLSQTASPLDLSLSPSTTEEVPLTTCQLEAVRPPNEIEMNEILRISFVGMMEVRNEMQEHIEMLRTVWKREDLVKVVTELERLEGERLKAVESKPFHLSFSVVSFQDETDRSDDLDD